MLLISILSVALGFSIHRCCICSSYPQNTQSVILSELNSRMAAAEANQTKLTDALGDSLWSAVNSAATALDSTQASVHAQLSSAGRLLSGVTGSMNSLASTLANNEQLDAQAISAVERSLQEINRSLAIAEASSTSTGPASSGHVGAHWTHWGRRDCPTGTVRIVE